MSCLRSSFASGDGVSGTASGAAEEVESLHRVRSRATHEPWQRRRPKFPRQASLHAPDPTGLCRFLVKGRAATARDRKVTHQRAWMNSFHHPTRRCLDRFGPEFRRIFSWPGSHRELPGRAIAALSLILGRSDPHRAWGSSVTDPTEKSRSGSRSTLPCPALVPVPAVRTQVVGPSDRRQGRPGFAVSPALASSWTTAQGGPMFDRGPGFGPGAPRSDYPRNGVHARNLYC